MSVIDYSPRERNILRLKQFAGTSWQTNETPPRKVTIAGPAMIDPDVMVIRIEDDNRPYWLMSCGSTLDGAVIGTDIYIRECLP